MAHAADGRNPDRGRLPSARGPARLSIGPAVDLALFGALDGSLRL